MGVCLRVRSAWTSKSAGAEALYEFDAPRIVIGRSAGADVQLPHPAVSTAHAVIRTEGTRVVLVDEGSTNGTRFNGERLVAGRPKPLRTGDVIEIGGFFLTIETRVVVEPTSAEKTGVLARRLLRDILDAGSTEQTELSLTIGNGPNVGRRLGLPAAPCSVVLGRGETCGLPIDDADASREHAEVVRDAESVVVRDLGSKNGTLVNGKRIEVERALSDRDEITIGATVVVFEDPAQAMVAELRSAPEVAFAMLGTEWQPPVEGARPDPVPPAEPEAEQDDGSISMEVVTAPPAAALGARTDTLIYVLAGTVLALSVAGLVWLLQAG